jgi:predicted nucleic acid-binding protein
MKLILEKQLTPCHDYRIINEYRQVLSRPKFRFKPTDIGDLLDFFIKSGVSITAESDNSYFIDESDRKFYEVAKSTGAILITGNLKHYPTEPHIMNPADFIGYYDEKIAGQRP